MYEYLPSDIENLIRDFEKAVQDKADASLNLNLCPDSVMADEYERAKERVEYIRKELTDNILSRLSFASSMRKYNSQAA